MAPGQVGQVGQKHWDSPVPVVGRSGTGRVSLSVGERPLCPTTTAGKSRQKKKSVACPSARERQRSLFDVPTFGETPAVVPAKGGQPVHLKQTRRPRPAAGKNGGRKSSLPDPKWAAVFMVLPHEADEAEAKYGHLVGGKS